MIEGFENGCYWFIDSRYLRSVANNWATNGNSLAHIGYKWNAWGLKRDEIFSTGKGNKKNDIPYPQEHNLIGCPYIGKKSYVKRYKAYEGLYCISS